MEKRILLNDQSDGFRPDNPPDKSSTTLSTETLEMRREASKLYERIADGNSISIKQPTIDSNSALSVSVEETPANNTYIEPRELRNGN